MLRQASGRGISARTRQCPPEPQAEDFAGRSADPSLPPEHDQQRDAGHRMGNGERQIDDGGDDFLATKFRAREDIGQRHAEQRGPGCRQEGRQKTEPNRNADIRHGGHPSETGRGLHRREPNQRRQDERQQQAADEPERQDDAVRSRWCFPHWRGQGLTRARRLSGMASTPTA